MEISGNRKTIIAVGAVLLLIIIVYSIPLALNAVEPQVCTINGQCEHEIFANNLIKSVPLVLLAGMAIGAAGYYFFSERKAIASKPINREAIYMLLDEDERKVLAKLVENRGKAFQSELSYIEGIGKVKAHRLIERMSKKGIIEKEAFGKTNSVKLNKDLAQLFLQ